jgi:putative oxidoreductase
MADALGKLLLRVVLGVVILLHGLDKLANGIDGIQKMVAGAGLPSFVAYGVYLGELVGPVLLLAGWYSRVGAGLIAVNMLFAIGLAHAGEVFALNRHGGWAIEAQMTMLAAAVALALIGPGRLALNSR